MPNPPKIFGSLVAEVVRKDLCMYCGTCIASCPVNVLQYSDEEIPVIKGMCVLCELCYYSCPRIEFPLNEYEENLLGRSRSSKESLGVVRNAYFARTTDSDLLKVAQDGGVASALLIYALEKKLIDLAAVTGFEPDNPLKPKPFLASNREEIMAVAGSRYSPGGSVAVLGDAVMGYPEAKIGFVGLPCQIQGLTRLQFSPKGNNKRSDNILFTIGVFCLNSFHHKKLYADHLQKSHNLDLSSIRKVDIKKGKLYVSTDEGESEGIPVKDFSPSRIKGCSKCQDFTGELADISVGAVDASSGWCTVLTRTEKGDKLIKELCKNGSLECKPVKDASKALIQTTKLSLKKREREAPYQKVSLKAEAR